MLGIDLCAGSGWAVACDALGISELGIEIMPEAIATRDAMGAFTQNVSIADLPDAFCHQAPIQIAGPPCQTFSPAGNGEGRKALDEVLRRVRLFGSTGEFIRDGDGDPRTWLVLEPLRLAIGGMPTYIVWEQVPPVLPVWEACGDVLRAAGYSVVTGILNSEQYGVPQTRRRAFLLARRDGVQARFPAPTHSRYHNRDPERLDKDVLPWVSMAEALGFDGVMRSNYGTGANAERRSPESPAPTVHFGARANGVYWQYRSSTMPNATVRSGTEPAPTVAFGNDANSVQLAGRRVTVAEAAALQTFPPGHPFRGSMTKQYLQIGNAVPPLLGKAILSTFLTETT